MNLFMKHLLAFSLLTSSVLAAEDGKANYTLYCSACHAQKVGGDGSAIYRPSGRLNTAGLLRGMVEQCNTTLNLSLFPDEVTAIAAVLNQQHYKHKN